MQNPKISVITVCFNAVHAIEETILSIITQKYDNIEYIIVDGGSTDGTVDIIKKYKDRITYWISEPDDGIYDAMNKGIEIATGDYIIFINIGDKLLSIPSDILISDLGRPTLGVCGAIIDENNYVFYPQCSWLMKLQNKLPHQGLFYKSSIIRQNPYNQRYKIVADYELNLRLLKKGYTITTINRIIAFHDNTGISRGPKSAKESLLVIKANLGLFWYCFSYLYRKYHGLKHRITHL